MGSDSGYLALTSALATGAERVYLPEVGVTLDQLSEDVATLTDGLRDTASSSACIVRSERADRDLHHRVRPVGVRERERRRRSTRARRSSATCSRAATRRRSTASRRRGSRSGASTACSATSRRGTPAGRWSACRAAASPSPRSQRLPRPARRRTPRRPADAAVARGPAAHRPRDVPAGVTTPPGASVPSCDTDGGTPDAGHHRRGVAALRSFTRGHRHRGRQRRAAHPGRPQRHHGGVRVDRPRRPAPAAGDHHRLRRRR